MIRTFRVQKLCERRGGRQALSVLMRLTVSVDVKQHWTMLRHWSQFVPNMSTDIRGHEALLHHHRRIACECSESARERRLALYKSNYHHHQRLCGQRVFSMIQAVTLCAGFHKSDKNMIILISKDSICILMSCQKQHRVISGRQGTKDKGLCIWEGRTLHRLCLMWIINAATFPNNACVMMCEMKARSSQHWMPHPSSYCPAQTKTVDLWHCQWVT